MIEMDAKIDARTTQNHQKLRFAFRKRFWRLSGSQFPQTGANLGARFGSYFRLKVEQRHPKADAKIDAEKVL